MNNYNILLNNINLSENIKAYNMALGNITGEIEMYVETFNQGILILYLIKRK